MSDMFELPPPCPFGSHIPAIIHRTGGRERGDVEYYNVCAECGHQTERHDLNPRSWVTKDQADAIAEEQRVEWEEEVERDQEEACHPEWRCPPRE